MKVESCKILHAKILLSTPYILSFATVSEIDSIIVQITSQSGAVGTAEAVPLPGYSHETAETIISDLKLALVELPGMNLSDISQFMNGRFVDSPFVISAVITAVEFLTGYIEIPDTIQVPLLAAVSAAPDSTKLLLDSLKLYEDGFKTIKLKVGRDIDVDLLCVEKLLNELPDTIKLRIDANQAYDLHEARKLLSLCEHPKAGIIECIEQPFGISDWEKFRVLSSDFSNVPLMLDESIITEEDIDRAAEVGAKLVKLKLFKQHGVSELIHLAKKADLLGMDVILGNGVSSDIGNLTEALAFVQFGGFLGASEGNGFAKLNSNILKNSLNVTNGNLTWNKASSDINELRFPFPTLVEEYRI